MGAIAHYGSPQNYGNQFHLRAAEEINNVWREQLIPELYIMSQLDSVSDNSYQRVVRPREAGSIGLDVYEQIDDDIACIYDFKTGKRGLSGRRMTHFSSASAKRFPRVNKFFVIEIKPSIGSSSGVD